MVAGQAPITLELKTYLGKKIKQARTMVHTITEAHIYLYTGRQNMSKGGPRAYVSGTYMRHAVQVATEAEKTTHYPEKQ